MTSSGTTSPTRTYGNHIIEKHPELALKTPQTYVPQRKIHSYREVLDPWFDAVLERLSKPDVDGDLIIHVDETPLLLGLVKL